MLVQRLKNLLRVPLVLKGPKRQSRLDGVASSKMALSLAGNIHVQIQNIDSAKTARAPFTCS
jgi:hypothetical protein